MKKSELRNLIKEELNNIKEASNAHPFVLRAIQELKDDLDFYLKNEVDFDLLKKKMAELVKLIKQYQS